MGIVVAIVLVMCIGGFAVMFMAARSAVHGVAAPAKAKADQETCLSNMKQLMLGTFQYESDHGEVLPQASSWLTDIQPYMKVDLTCPAGAEYVMNPRVSGQPFDAIAEPARTVFAYEALGGKPAFIHDGNCVVAFCDGHVRTVNEKATANYVW